MATQRFSRDEIMAAYAAVVAAGDAGDWDRWADLHTVDCVWNEHHYGIIEGRDAIRSKIIELMAAVPMMTFPVEWVATARRGDCRRARALFNNVSMTHQASIS